MGSVSIVADRAGALVSTLVGLFFNRAGRISQRTFWGAASAAWAMFWIAYVVLDGAGPVDLTRVPAFVLLASLFCLCSKRYHDMDRSAAWLLLLLLPVVGALVVCWELGFRRGTVGANAFGDDPRMARYQQRDYATVT